MTKDHDKTKCYTLREAFCMLAYGDPNGDSSFEAYLLGGPNWVIQADHIDEEAEKLRQLLRDGHLTAKGKLHHANGVQCSEHPLDDIPSEHWDRLDPGWSLNRQELPSYAYYDVRIPKKQLEILLKTDGPTPVAERSRRRPGRPPEYDHADFWQIATINFAQHGVPTSQTIFINQIEPVIAQIWGEKSCPKETWFKDRWKEIMGTKKKYDSLVDNPSESGHTDDR